MATNWSNVTTAYDYLNIPNQNTGGYFWLGMVWMVFIVMLISFISLGVGIEVALLASAFAGLVMVIFLAYVGLVAFGWVLFFAGILLALFLYILWSRGKNV